jgi:hypothetical protein
VRCPASDLHYQEPEALTQPVRPRAERKRGWRPNSTDAQDACAGEDKDNGDCAQTEADTGSDVSASNETWGDVGRRSEEERDEVSSRWQLPYRAAAIGIKLHDESQHPVREFMRHLELSPQLLADLGLHGMAKNNLVRPVSKIPLAVHIGFAD